jgi:threonine/homoserine/homoserine lactone efflux protein
VGRLARRGGDLARQDRGRECGRQVLRPRPRHNLLNPKAGIFYVAVLPTFVDPSRSLVGQTITLSVVYVAVASLVHGTIVLLADAARPLLEDERRSTLVRRALALVLACIALWLLATTRR